jgi:hypothetical protein
LGSNSFSKTVIASGVGVTVGVLVDVTVGGTGVAVGGIGVAVGGTGVLVAAAGTVVDVGAWNGVPSEKLIPGRDGPEPEGPGPDGPGPDGPTGGG